MVIDGISLIWWEPYLYVKESNRKWYTQQINHDRFRWEIGTCIRTVNICWFNGPFNYGIMPDISIFSLNLKHKILPGERVIADGGYRGDPKVLSTVKYSRYQINHIFKVIGKLCACHEKINGCFKNWGRLRQMWRHSDKKMCSCSKIIYFCE